MFITATIPSTVTGTPTHARHLVDADDRERERVDVHAEPGRDRGREHLAAELLPPVQDAEVVDRADRRRDGGAEQDAAQVAAERQERERRNEHAEEEREPAEARDRRRGRAPLPAAARSGAGSARAGRPRREHEHDREARRAAP